MAEKKVDADSRKQSYRESLNLPQTEFPIRPSSAQDDPEMIACWKAEKLYQKTAQAHPGQASFILRDGPPYANGNIHIGHAYNKILKDIIAKSQRMQNKFVPVVPGWDCHGLPIEIKVAQTINKDEVGTLAFIKACREYAADWVTRQKEQFICLGVLMEWDRPYLTMDPHYEAETIRAFNQLLEKGYITRHNKTIPWCPSCQTTLAQAEIEYAERKDPSIYVPFELLDHSSIEPLAALQGPVSVVIWTTTPWTIPLNRAVLVHPQASYAVIRKDNQYYLVAQQSANALAELYGATRTDVTVTGQQLLDAGIRVQHPLLDELQVPLIPSEEVTLSDGTAFVHCAPGCGPEDYLIGITHGLDIYSPVGPDGTYTEAIEPKELVGMPVSDGQIWVIKNLAARGTLLHKTSLRHSYPHCWRCQGGLIFRATKQWFCDLAKHDMKYRVLGALSSIKAFPPASMNRLRATIEGRLEWCVSRQRVWGVPIPALLCNVCDASYTSSELSNAVANQVQYQGVEYWHTVPVEDLPGADKPCETCTSTAWRKEYDILDVWFDSGISHAAVEKQHPEQRVPADMYIEGKDQHRGWFQSSLLTSMIMHDRSPFLELLTHGFVVDEHGYKMSKSRGNVVNPEQMMDKLGTDGLRLWVASVDYVDDAPVSPILITNVAQVFRKIRNTCRFLISNIHDFNFDTDGINVERLTPIDQYALAELRKQYTAIVRAYNQYDITAVSHVLADYCATDLSALYLDIIKDRLYCDAKQGHSRRAAQTVCWYVLDTLVRLTAPIMSFTAEQLAALYQPNGSGSIHLQQFIEPPAVWDIVAVRHAPEGERSAVQDIYGGKAPTVPLTQQRWGQWDALHMLREAVLKAIERVREQGVIKHSLEARVILHLDGQTSADTINVIRDYFDELSRHEINPERMLEQWFIVSQVELASSSEGLVATPVAGVSIGVTPAQGVKCPRCWRYTRSNHVDGLCARCTDVVRTGGNA